MESEACLCISPLDKVSLITPALCHFTARCPKTNYMVRQLEKWVLHVGMVFRHCTLVTVTHLFKAIISTASRHSQYTFTK